VTKIEFVLLAESSAHENALAQLHTIALHPPAHGGLLIWTGSVRETRALDQYLSRAANETTSLQHQCAVVKPENARRHCLNDAQILIAHEGEPDGSHTTLINMTDRVP